MADVISGNRMEAESSADKSILDDVQLQLVPITAVMQPMIFCRTLIQVRHLFPCKSSHTVAQLNSYCHIFVSIYTSPKYLDEADVTESNFATGWF